MNLVEAVKRACEEATLLSALTWISVWETERVVRQALKNCYMDGEILVTKDDADASHGCGWDTNFWVCQKEVMAMWNRLHPKANTITELMVACHEVAVQHGWVGGDHEHYPTQFALMHSEISEAMDSYRHNEPLLWYREPDGKPEGIAAEFADIIMRVAHVSQVKGIDLQQAINEKLAYNMKRQWKQENKNV